MALTTRLPSTKVDPFYVFVETTGDALRLIQAAREGIIPRTTRRLNDLERRNMVRSGSVFIFSDEESGIKRWTEGLSWSASRIVGNFLVYREVTDRAHARSPPEGRRASRRRGITNDLSPEELAEQKLSKSLVGCLSDNNGRFKANGLIKKTITIGVEGTEHHLIAYYNQQDVKLGKLRPLSSRPDIMAIDIPPELLESTKFRIPPVIENGPDGRPRYICDAEDGLAETSGQISLPFPSISRTTLSYQRVTPTRPRPPHPTSSPASYLPSTPIEPSRQSYPQQCHSSPSTCSTTSSTSVDTNAYNWFSASMTPGAIWPSPSAEAQSLCSATGAEELARAQGPAGPLSSFAFSAVYFPQEVDAAGAQPSDVVSGSSATTGLLPAWHEAPSGQHIHHFNQSHSQNALGTYALLGSADSAGFVSPDAYQQSATMACASASSPYRGMSYTTQTPHGLYTQSPMEYGSVPVTPAHPLPRHSQRFTSLPSLYTTGVCDTSSISPLSLSPLAGDEQGAFPDPSPVSLSSPHNVSTLSSASWS